MIAAMDRHRVIGYPEGGLPWRLPEDVRRFRAYTEGKHLLLGRRTFQEMTGWFSTHFPIVLTHERGFETSGPGRVAHTVEEAVTEAFEAGAKELVVIGGAKSFVAALPYADELVLTAVDTEVADAKGRDLESLPRFPDYLDGIEWETLSEEHCPIDEENPMAMTFRTLRRLRPSSLRPGRLHLR